MKIVKNQSGLTVVEIIVGLGVLTIFVFSISVIMRSTADLNDQSADITLANGIAEEKLEGLRSAGFLNLPADGTIVVFTDDLPGTFKSPRSAEYVVSDENPSLKRIDLTIEYTIGGISEEANYSSFIGESGVGQ